jgi:two-component system, sensor histidine kinase and response regulator
MKRILIIEDDKDLLEEISDILKFEGYDFIPCQSGEQGIHLAQKNNPDLILCDIVMPGISGFDVLSELRKDKTTSVIPFIIITALDENKNLRKGMEMGADDYLIKPFSRIELINTLKARLLKHDIMSKNIAEVRDRIIYALPHEFRTPVNTIMGFGEIIRDEAENMVAEDISVMGRSIYESGVRLYEIIIKYLTYVDIEVNREKKRFTVVNNLSGMLEKTIFNVAMNRNRVDDYVVNMTDCRIEVVEEWFIFAIKELIDNAFKFSESGKPVSVDSKSSGNSIEILIKDEGHGFPPEVINKIDMFVQFDRAGFEQQGIGMGLFLAKKIIELHAGSLSIERINGSGSVVKIILPCIN